MNDTLLVLGLAFHINLLLCGLLRFELHFSPGFHRRCNVPKLLYNFHSFKLNRVLLGSHRSPLVRRSRVPLVFTTGVYTAKRLGSAPPPATI